MPLLVTSRNDDEGTAKETLRISDFWIPAVHYHPDDENQITLVIEDMDNRFALDIYVTNREAAVTAFDQLFTTLQELQIEE